MLWEVTTSYSKHVQVACVHLNGHEKAKIVMSEKILPMYSPIPYFLHKKWVIQIWAILEYIYTTVCFMQKVNSNCECSNRHKHF